MLLGASALAAAGLQAQNSLVAYFDMEVSGDQITERVTGNKYNVQGHFAPENLPGAEGQALRFDGYTSYVDAQIGALPSDAKDMTLSCWVAVPCYPIVKIDQQTTEKVAIVSCLDEQAKTGFGFFLGFDGKYAFRTYVNGWAVDVNIDTPLPVYQWNNLVAVLSSTDKTVRVYNNGELVGSAKCNGTPAWAGGTFRMGHGTNENYSGPFLLTSYNGLIDEVKVWSEAIPESEIKGWKAENAANLMIPASRYENQLLRPRFHGMPATAWTNECHGMTWADGKYHLFFQKNADGPYMARLHWGHIASTNLYDWQEEEIALAPGEWYDIKGCWSGCVFTDEEITGSKPGIIYTGVDYAKAMICQASPLDEQLIKWQKASNNPIINGRPSGLSDDFRDPYFFRSGDNAYIIVGSSKGGVGTTTLHKYNPSSKTWSNDGALFFTGANSYQDGTFWEMPTVTPMADGKWLFTVTPLNTSLGVRTLYYTGTINADGTFAPSSTTPKLVELTSKDGFGLLSPTIYQHEGKTIALGIVPDKLSSQDNWNLGWAHCYSLPREWSLDSNGTLIQKPFSGLTGLRSKDGYSETDITLNGTREIEGVSGRQVELLATFTMGNSPVGFNFFKNGSAYGSVTYNPANGQLTADFTRLSRLVNDNGSYSGKYTATLPEVVRAGGELKLNLFVDGSIVDIFVNDKWATSIRVFPTDENANGCEVFAEGETTVKSLQGWNLNPKNNSSVGDLFSDNAAGQQGPVDVYDMQGVRVLSGVNPAEATASLPAGLYLVGDRKVLVK